MSLDSSFDGFLGDDGSTLRQIGQLDLSAEHPGKYFVFTYSGTEYVVRVNLDRSIDLFASDDSGLGDDFDVFRADVLQSFQRELSEFYRENNSENFRQN